MSEVSFFWEVAGKAAKCRLKNKRRVTHKGGLDELLQRFQEKESQQQSQEPKRQQQSQRYGQLGTSHPFPKTFGIIPTKDTSHFKNPCTKRKGFLSFKNTFLL